MTNQSITIHGLRETTPGARWTALFDATWPAYRRWYLSEGRSARPSAAAARTALQRHMPQLVPVWEQLVGLTGDDQTAAAMLTGWNLPAFAPACSQAVVTGDERALIRNYDYHPDLFEQVSMSTRFADRDVIGTNDCLWGLLDGMNDDGLVVSLTFAGRPGSGMGFGIPLVLRYLLETASTTPEAVAVLRRVPVSMSYNLTISDAAGRTRTAYVDRDHRVEVRPQALATNHRFDERVPAVREQRFGTGRRFATLRDLLDDGTPPDRMAAAFLRDPLRQTDYAGGFGTLYTADYRPDSGTVHYRWPGTTWSRGFDSSDAEVRVDVGCE
jgi:predicted choloylglycine hydrolase